MEFSDINCMHHYVFTSMRDNCKMSIVVAIWEDYQVPPEFDKGERDRMNDPTAEEVIEPVETFVNTTLKERLRSTMHAHYTCEQQLKD